MLNIYDYLRNHAHKFRQFKVDELLFAEYHCLIKEAKLGAWTHNNFFTYVLSGNKGVSCGGKDYLLEAGDCFFMKKGAYIAHQYFDEEYCAIIIFVPDDFIKKAIQKHRVNCPHESNMQKILFFFD